MLSDTFATWKDKLLFWSVTVFILSSVAWASWITTQSMSHITRKEAVELIQLTAPYNQDRELIRSQVHTAAEAGKDMRRVIEKNTEAINALTIEIAKMQD